ncbi:MAG: hypothetical protein LIP05_07120 [Tannerellaceae bacterium]|nr:hypothetical protein [Tannerellaceae bacterium]
MNNLVVNGKEIRFTPQEISVLQRALLDLSKGIEETANGLSISCC